MVREMVSPSAVLLRAVAVMVATPVPTAVSSPVSSSMTSASPSGWYSITPVFSLGIQTFSKEKSQ